MLVREEWTISAGTPNLVALAYMHSGFPSKLLEQTIVTSVYDITRVSHVR